MEHNSRFFSQLKRHEGLELEAYICPAGVLTIGWGHNCDAHPVAGVKQVGDVISRTTADMLLLKDVAMSAAELDRVIPWWRELSEPRQAVILNMHFNMGWPKLRGFKKFLAAAEAGYWNRAAFEMGDSRWANQVKGRSRELITQMALGAWQEG